MKEYPESEFIQLSSLQHMLFCERQCALIHVEQLWSENRFTAEGRAQHERVDRPEHESRAGVRTEYAVLLRSLQLGLIGKADAVEFEGDRVFPVEHKRGRPKPDHCDWVQLCAQALCLEEMMSVKVPQGAIFYGKPRRRQVVTFDPALREETREVILAVHELIRSGKTPPPVYEKKKCDACSLNELCMPTVCKHVAGYLQEALS